MGKFTLPATACECGKRAYSKEVARSMASSRTKRDGVPWAAYKCPFVSKVWHVGHQRRDDYATERAEARRRIRDAGYRIPPSIPESEAS